MKTDGVSGYLDADAEVRAALGDGLPVVALETTILCHGMPWPQNLETARRMQQAVRDAGAVPAFVAIVGGRLKVGLTPAETERLAGLGAAVPKASRRDLAFLVSRRADGATTVAATMIVAALAGIRVFATGGIGGVHRGAEATMDVSADLEELARSRVAVVCAGVKSVLDLPRTLEYLETRGVPVAGFGTDTLPAFYAVDSGLPVDYRIDEPAEAARAMKAHWDLGLDGGIVIAAPVPASHALAGSEVEAVIDEALADMRRSGIGGKAVTPFLLGRIAERTGGRSLAANVELAVNNAAVGGRIAVEYARLVRAGGSSAGTSR